MSEETPKNHVDKFKEFSESHFMGEIAKYKSILKTVEKEINQSLGLSIDSFSVTEEYMATQKTESKIISLNGNSAKLLELFEEFSKDLGEALFMKIVNLRFNNPHDDDVRKFVDGFTLENLDREGWDIFLNSIFPEDTMFKIKLFLETNEKKDKSLLENYTEAILYAGAEKFHGKFLQLAVEN